MPGAWARLLVLAACIAPSPAIAEPERKFENLQVLPADIEKKELLGIMKRMAKELGTKCEHCHRTATKDYASDAIEAKRTAREMMRMVARIERELFTWRDAPRPTCFMCHRGALEPKLEPPGAKRC